MLQPNVRLLSLVTAISLFALNLKPAVAGNYAEVWSTVKERPYSRLPQHPTTLASFFEYGNNKLFWDAKRTLNTSLDILPRFQKLVHPIGICYSGMWEITKATDYTGYFQKGARGLIIVRASEAMGQPLKGDYRSFGFAGKIYPTTDKADTESYKTANFFTVDDLIGTLSDSFLDLHKTNQPAKTPHLSSIFSAPLIGTIIATFLKVDSNAGYRNVDAIAELGMADPSKARAPKLMAISPDTEPTVADRTTDFRDELRLANYRGHKLQFGIHIAEDDDAQWNRIGQITLTEEALSEGCDHRLHFQHPRSK